MGQKTSFFHEASKVEGVFTSNRFVSMIRSSKHFWGHVFFQTYSCHHISWIDGKNFFWSFDIFHFFWLFLRIFSLLKKSCKFEKSNLRGIYFQNKIFSWLKQIWKSKVGVLQRKVRTFFLWQKFGQHLFWK